MDGCRYAVKRLEQRLGRSGSERNRYLREAYAWAALADCPKLVRYYDSWVEDDHLHIQVELCPGGTLEALVFGDEVSGRVRGCPDRRGD